MTNKFAFRYVSEPEWKAIQMRGYIESRSGATYFTTDCYADTAEAQQKLALERRPEWRIGPIPLDWFDDRIREGLASPKYGQPGGGQEFAVVSKTYVFQAVRLMTNGPLTDKEAKEL